MARRPLQDQEVQGKLFVHFIQKHLNQHNMSEYRLSKGQLFSDENFK